MSPTSDEPAAFDRDRLIESHLPLVRAIARRFAGRGEPLDDLVQIGSLALVSASDRFDPNRGVTFATFATPAVEGAIRRHLGERTTPMRIPRELRRLSGQIERRRAQLAASLGREPTLDELASALGVERPDVEQAIGVAHARSTVPESADVTEAAGDYEFPPSTDDRLLLALAARVLDERERRIVLLRFHADMTEREIAREVRLSQAQVSRLLRGALVKLRGELEAPEDADISRSEEEVAGETGSRTQEIVQHRGVRHARRQPRSRIEPVAVSEQKAEPEVIDAPQSRQRSKRRAGSTASGRFLVRMPSELHQELALAAERDDISLNRYVTEALAASVGGSATAVASERPAVRFEAGPSAPAPRRSFRMLLAANVIVMVLAAAAAIALVILALERGI